jgi:hypothetical protein
MKPLKIIVITAFVMIAVALITASTYAYFWSGNRVAVTNQSSNGNYGTYGAYPNGMMGGNMGGMMGGNWGYQPGVQSPAPVQNTASPVNLGFTILIVGAVATVGTGSLTYYLAHTKIDTPKQVAESCVKNPTPNAVTPYASVSKTLTEEERQFLSVLVSHNGKYLQKYIRAEMGLSRLKTHRVVARLAERGIVTLEKSGNTNEVSLASWLQNSNGLEQNQR